ncbi:hypothetical protein QX204_19355 [Nocardia sp. PE-7]|uniref:hypothetical protein n=1 Tax=Nocardia sp. PE-7 TaxID=3058426 RepID=UPI00265AFB67|nr:hypothetical protein [Nocardia sp. PE-7]WKG07267.1 hypothetical protein QX204_19355 [Nocardia sp. PE-7]
MTHTVTDSPDPSVTDRGRRYLATDGRDGPREGGTTDHLVLTTLGRRTGVYLHHAPLAARPIPVVVLERVEEQQ